ncbi:MAG: HAD family phosphatase [Elainella sp. Prado103]|jgi:beta-phosphoglucomutase|nr:HAD family phosphatase [Elainella sp. Prado103]
MLKALLLDLDGTIVETDSLHFRIWQDFLRDYGLEIDRPFYKARISGRLNPDILADLLPQLSRDQHLEFADHKEAEFRRQAGQLVPMPGLLEWISWAEQQGLPLAVVTNAPRENAWFMLRSLHLESRLATVVISDDLPYGKPHPFPYQEALRRLQIQPSEAIAFEDSPSGLQSAVAAGILTIGIASTHAPEVLYPLGASLVIHDFTDERLNQLLPSKLLPNDGLPAHCPEPQPETPLPIG